MFCKVLLDTFPKVTFLGYIDKAKLNLMKKHSIIVNTSRGPIIKEQDLIDALNNETIGGAALDVFDKEPLPKLKNIYPGVNQKLDGIIQKATAKDPSKRFKSCDEFKKALLKITEKSIKNEKTIIINEIGKILVLISLFKKTYQTT